MYFIIYAIEIIRKAVNSAEELKKKCETRVLEILSGSKQEISRLQVENQRNITEKTTKVNKILNTNYH